MGNALLIRQKISSGIAEAAFAKGSVSTIGWAWFRNYDNSKTISIRTTTSGTVFLTLLPNSEVLIYIGTTMAPYHISPDGTAILEYALFAA